MVNKNIKLQKPFDIEKELLQLKERVKQLEQEKQFLEGRLSALSKRTNKVRIFYTTIPIKIMEKSCK